MASTVEIIVKATDQATKVLKGTSGGFKSLTGEVKNFVTGAVSIAAVTKALTDCLNAAKEAETVMAATEAVITSTGGAAGYTADQISDLALKESQLTSIDDEVVQSGMNILLTFNKIGQETFPRATRATEDMAVALAGGNTAMIDLKGTARILGKALQDPVNGLDTLQRYGIRFTDAQKAVIKSLVDTGDAAAAQGIILDELELKFGGMAEKMGTTDAGKIQKAENAIENLKEAIGNKLLPVVGKLAEYAEIIITVTDKSRIALIEHESEIRKTARSWVDYSYEIGRSLDMINKIPGAANYAIDANGDLRDMLGNVVQENFYLTESEWKLKGVIDDRRESINKLNGVTELFIPTEEELAEAEEKAKEEAQKLNDEMSKLSTLMAGSLGDENKRYGETLLQIDEDQKDLQETIDETIDKIADLKAKYREADTKDQRKNIQDDIDQEKDKLGELIEKQGEYKQKIIDVANEHEEATKRILFGLLQQQLAIDGLTTEEGKALSEVAESWGLIDADTKLAWDRIQEYIGSLNGAKIKAGDLEKAIKGIPSEKNINLNVNTTFSSAFMSTMTPQQIAAATFHWGQSGMEGIVPPGYSEPNNPFVIGASEGEGVKIIPKDKMNNGGGIEGDTININFYGTQISGYNDLETLAQELAGIIKRNQSRR